MEKLLGPLLLAAWFVSSVPLAAATGDPLVGFFYYFKVGTDRFVGYSMEISNIAGEGSGRTSTNQLFQSRGGSS